MRVAPEQLPRHLEKGPAALYAICGDEPLLVWEAAHAVRQAAAAADFGERETFIVERGFDWSRFAEAAASLSLFAAKRLLEIRIPTGKPGIDGGAALARHVAALPVDTLTLIILPRLDRQLRTTAWFEALERRGVVVAVEPVARERLPAWIGARLKSQGQSAEAAALAFMAERVEGNLLAAHQEIQKLGLLYPAATLSFEQVKDAVLDVARYDVFQLGAALLKGDAAATVRILDGLQGEGAAPPLVLWAIAQEIRVLLNIAEQVAAGRSRAEALRAARVWGPRQELIPAALRRLSRDRLEALLAGACRADRVAKGLSGGRVWDELMSLALACCVPAAAPQSRYDMNFSWPFSGYV